MPRVQMSDEDFAAAMDLVHDMLQRRRQEKGDHSLASVHEVMGLVAEEHHELLRSVEAGDQSAVEDELIDVAVACIVAIASRPWLDW